MKKGNKGLLIMAAILLGTGLVATTAGLMMGASFRDTDFGLVDIDRRGNVTVLSNQSEPQQSHTAPAAPEAPAAPAKPGVASVGSRDWQYVMNESYDQDIRKINLSAGPGEVEIVEGDSFSIEADGDKVVEYRSYLETDDGVLEWNIECKVDHKIKLNGVDAYLTITIPKGWVADEWDVELGMGSMTAEAIRGTEVDLMVGMGEITVAQLESGRASLECDMGQLTVDNAVVTGRTEVECGMGQLNMTVEGNEDNYGARLSVGMGSVQVGTRSVGGMGGNLEFNTKSANIFNGDCGMGQITIDFTN